MKRGRNHATLLVAVVEGEENREKEKRDDRIEDS